MMPVFVAALSAWSALTSQLTSPASGRLTYLGRILSVGRSSAMIAFVAARPAWFAAASPLPSPASGHCLVHLGHGTSVGRSSHLSKTPKERPLLRRPVLRTGAARLVEQDSLGGARVLSLLNIEFGRGRNHI